MKLISTLIFLLCVTFAFAECYDNHFDECRIERQNGKYGIVIDKQLAIPYEYDEIVPQHNCFFKVRKGRKYGIISYFYEEHKRDGRFPKEIDRPIALKKGYAWLYLSLACEYDKIEEYENQYLQISRDDRKGIVNYYGTLVLPCRFEKIELSNNFFWVSSEGLYGIYNRYGSTIIPCRYNQIELTDRCFYVCRDRLQRGLQPLWKCYYPLPIQPDRMQRQCLLRDKRQISGHIQPVRFGNRSYPIHFDIQRRGEIPG